MADDLVPMIPKQANEELEFSGNDLAVVIAVDEKGKYKVFRSRNATDGAREMTFPIPAGKEVTFMETFTVFKTNPTCYKAGGVTVCW